MGYFETIKADWKANVHNPKGRIVLLFFRTAQLINSHRALKFLLFPYLVLYVIIVEWGLGIELSYKSTVGKGLGLYHAQALVVNPNTVIGDYCTLRQSTTLGNKGYSLLSNDSPVIGDHVDIGSNVCIIGNIHVGDHAVIGAGSVVVRDVPIRGVAVGNPAKTIKIKSNPDFIGYKSMQPAIEMLPEKVRRRASLHF